MLRLAALAVVVAASSAFATGERITINGAPQLNDTLCLQMTCVESGAKDFSVTAKPAKNGLEVTVVSASGSTRLTQLVALNGDGVIGNTDLVRLTSQVFRAIEEGPTAPTPKTAAPNKALAAKKALKRAIAHR